MNAQENHRLLSGYISKHGIHNAKKHGSWVILRLFKDYYLSMDGWNRAIHFKRGAGKYNYWLGFGAEDMDKIICYLGGDWGGFSPPDREETLAWIVDILGLTKKEKTENI